MTKLGQRLIKAAEEGVAIARGQLKESSYRVYVPDDIDVTKIRAKLGLSQSVFAAKFGIKEGTLQDWEQRRRKPEGAARVLLMVIAREPEAVRRALAPRRPPKVVPPKARRPSAERRSG